MELTEAPFRTQVSLVPLPVIAFVSGVLKRLSPGFGWIRTSRIAYVACRLPDSRGNVRSTQNYSVFKVHITGGLCAHFNLWDEGLE